MLTIGKGYDPSYLLDQVAAGREGYYTAAVTAGEPPGHWWGDGATLLGLSGQVNDTLMKAIYAGLVDPRDPRVLDKAQWTNAAKLGVAPRSYRTADDIYAELLARTVNPTPEQRTQLRLEAERQTRQAVMFLDLTFSAPKTVSIAGVAFERMANQARAVGDLPAAEAWAAHHRAVEDAVLAGASASMKFLQDVAGFSRVGHHGGGAGRWIDAHKFIVAQFLQHDSRDHDPQLHVHQALLNRVLCADGSWRALDTAAIYRYRAAAAAIGERVMETTLSRSLGVSWLPREDGHGRELAGVSRQLCDDMSSRRRAITEQESKMADAYRERYGSEPTPYQLNKWRDLAWRDTRSPKTYEGETSEARLDRWSSIADNTIQGGLEKTAWNILNAGLKGFKPDTFSPQLVADIAIALLENQRSTWNESDSLRAVSDALPGNLGLDPDNVRPFLEALTAKTVEQMIPVNEPESTTNIPESALLEDGRSPYQTPGGRRFTSEAVVKAEQMLRHAAINQGAEAMSREQAASYVARFADAGVELGYDQVAALVGVLTSGAWMETLSAAPGTGKTFAVGAIGEAWREHGKQTFGLATSQHATENLSHEAGLHSRNVSAWLAAQDRIAQGNVTEYDADLVMKPGALVVVDEASMTSSLDLAKIQQRCEQYGAKLLLVGDPHQLSAIGASGALADAAHHGIRYDLTEVRRFDQAWERHASLALRAGDKAALLDYQAHGRLVDAGTAQQAQQLAVNAWLADTLSGHETLLITGSNEKAAQLSSQIRTQLVELGKVSAHGVPLGLDGNTAGIGDIVAARHNGWDHRGWENNGTTAPINRQTYEVVDIRDDGGLSVVRRLPDGAQGPQMELKPEYVAHHLALGYASTAHAAEGRTVQRGHYLHSRGDSAETALVAMTRATQHNTVWGATREITDDQDPRDITFVEPTTTIAALASMLDAKTLAEGALAETEQAEIDARSTMTHADRLIDKVKYLTAGRTSLFLDELALNGRLSESDRARFAADAAAMWSVDALLRRAELAGHDPRVVLGDAVDRGSFDDARSAASVLHKRLSDNLEGRLEPAVTSHVDLIPPTVPGTWHPWLYDRAVDADNRRNELGAQFADEPPAWAIAALGPVPEDPVERLEWENKAGWAGAYREMAEYTCETDALGSPPPGGMPDKNALWATAHVALGLPEAGADERGKSDRQLQARVAAWEREKNWAPDHVADELAATSQAAQRAAQHATLADARAQVTQDAEAAQALQEQAQEASAAAERLAAQVQQLEQTTDARAQWFTHTAATRAAAERARAVLAERGTDVDQKDQQTTAHEWLEAHRAEQAQDEQTRPVRELDDADIDELRAAAAQNEPDVVLETTVPDIREITTPPVTESQDADNRWRVPEPDETQASVARARESLLEMHARDEMDRRNEEDTRLQELAEWHATQQAHEAEISAQQSEYESFMEATHE